MKAPAVLLLRSGLTIFEPEDEGGVFISFLVQVLERISRSHRCQSHERKIPLVKGASLLLVQSERAPMEQEATNKSFHNIKVDLRVRVTLIDYGGQHQLSRHDLWSKIIVGEVLCHRIGLFCQI